MTQEQFRMKWNRERVEARKYFERLMESATKDAAKRRKKRFPDQPNRIY